MNARDKSLIEHIFSHYKSINEILDQINRDYKTYNENDNVKKIIKMDLFQIGENFNHLSSEQKKKLNKADLKGVIDMRNQIAHAYITLKENIIWETIVEDLPRLINNLENSI